MVLKSRDVPVDWSAQDNPFKEALCRKYPSPLHQHDPWFDDPIEAMAICNGDSGGPVCPMRQRCLKRAMLNNERWGIWGGMYAHDRKVLKDTYPNNPEMWTWQPPTERDKRGHRRRQRASDRQVSERSSTTAAFRPFCSQTLDPMWSPKLDDLPTVVQMFYIRAAWPKPTGVLDSPIGI